MSPYLLLGFLFAGMLHVIMKPDRIARYLGKRNLKSVIYAALLGVPLPLCSCGVIPTGVSFYRNGASKGASVSFLISTPQTGVDSILVTYSMLGLPFAILRPIAAFLTGIAGGIFTNMMDNGWEQSPQDLQHQEHVNEKGKPLYRLLNYAFIEFMQDIVKWLVIGLLLAALISLIIPDDFFTMYMGNPFLEMAFVLMASVPLYVCATGSVPIAAVLLMKGLSPGAALVFLMAGPATNIATILVLSKTLGLRSTVIYLLTIIAGSAIFGILINAFFLDGFIMQSMLMHNHHQSTLMTWLSPVSSGLLLILIANAFYIKNKRRSEHKKIIKNMKIVNIRVNGMTCNHCKKSVETHLLNIQGITKVIANPDHNSVLIEGEDIDLVKVKDTVNGLGYDFKGESS